VSLLLLLGVVTVASRSGFGHAGNATTSRGFASYGLTAFLVVIAAGAPFALYFFVVQQRDGLQGPRKSFPRRVLENIAFVVLTVLIVAFGWRVVEGHGVFRHAIAAIHHRDSSLPIHPIKDGRQANAEPHFEWSVLWVALGIAAIAGVLLVRRRRAAAHAAATAETGVADDLVATIGDAIDDLEGEPDTRRAVIAAYARMEGVLARHGTTRRLSETPLEFLARVLAELNARSNAVERLTDLFEQAKFSRHEIDVTMKREAIDALRAIRDDVGGAAA
jgi:hypothetical protein